MKKSLLTLMCIAAMMAAGTSLKAQEVAIVLMPGWTWISVPSTDSLDFEAALGSFTPMAGDMIKSQWGTAMYMGDGQWRGSISQFYPGYGYMYKSTRTMPVMLTFNVQQPAPQVVVTTSDPTDITTNSATCGGDVTSSSGDNVFIILKGICWGTNPNPTFDDNYIEEGNGLGNFTVLLTELAPSTTYYVRAFAVTPTGIFYGDEISFHTQTWSNGILPGAFSVSANQQVYFSQGNLQYQASTNTWRFADKQYDYVGNANSNISPTYSGWIDLFGWGTSGWDNGNVYYNPWDSNNSNGSLYGPSGQYNLTGMYAEADWGVYNSINNGGYQENQWRTLNKDEWAYIFETRITPSGIRYAMARVNDVNGALLLPDDWNTATYSLNNTNSRSASYSDNVININQWAMLENAGAVFLPAAGCRKGNVMYYVDMDGDYWSSSCSSFGGQYASHVTFFNGFNSVYVSAFRYYGQSVRLVTDSEN